MKKLFVFFALGLLSLYSCRQESLQPSPVQVSSAREVASGGGGGGGGTACSPISSFTVKADVRVGELGVGAIDLNYSVKPCDKNQAVSITVQITNTKTGVVVLEDTNAPASGKYSYLGTRYYEVYQAKVSVYDANTKQLLGSQARSVSFAPKGV